MDPVSDTQTFRQDDPSSEINQETRTYAASTTRAWDLVSPQLDALVEAWDAGGEPPTLADFVPEGPFNTRHLALVELIKVDQEYRTERKLFRPLEEYLAEFPDLAVAGVVPCDLIYEEYHIRHSAGENVTPREYFDRFPAQAKELRQLLDLGSPYESTSLFSGELMQAIKPGGKVDDFDLLTELGRGAFATVFLARQRSMQRLVALKVSTKSADEGQTLANLWHPHIVRVFDQRPDSEKKLHLLYMQYVPGGTLQRVIQVARDQPLEKRNGRLLLKVVDEALVKRGEPMPPDSINRRRLAKANWPETVCLVGARLAAALGYAHSQDVLHRDVKPANVLLSADGHPLLADFNISFDAKSGRTTAAAYFGGSLAYMSPEQHEACNPTHERNPDELDGRSDVYSLGVVLWELLAGCRPFEDGEVSGSWAETLDRMAATRQAGVPQEAEASLPDDMPPGLVPVLRRCLSPERDERYATADQLARQLELCMHPGVQRLMYPKSTGRLRLVRRFPILMIVLAAMLPNVVLSALNLAYNFKEIIEEIIRKLSGESEAVMALFLTQITIINTVAYGVGIAILCWRAWPLVRVLHQVRAGPKIDPASLPLVRRHALTLGDWVAWISMSLWTLTGLIYPLWIHLSVGTTGVEPYIHFFLSQLLSGIVVGPLAFFLITFVVVRMLYPLVIDSDTPDTPVVEQMVGLSHRTWVYLGLGIAAPLLSVIVLAMIETKFKLAVLAIGAIGAMGIALGFFFTMNIRRDLHALAIAMTPDAGHLPAADSVDSVWETSAT